MKAVRDKHGVLYRPDSKDHIALSDDFSRTYGRGLDYAGVGEVVLDLGAHIGGFSVRAARRGCRVVAVEPLPANLELLRRNVQGYDVTIVEAAVGPTSQTAQLIYKEDHLNSARMERWRRKLDEKDITVEVEVVALDDLVRDHEPVVIKMDIENSEWDLLPASWPGVRALIAEIHTWHHTYDAWTALFEAMAHLGWETERVPPMSVFGKNVLWTRGEE